MDFLLFIWTLSLTLWTIWLWHSTALAHQQHTRWRIEQARWVARAEKLNRENIWKGKTNA